MEHIERVDIEELLKQKREEIMNTPHAMKIEVVIPPVTIESLFKEGMISPCVVTDANGGCNKFTVALALYTLGQYIESNLEDSEVEGAYKFIKCAIDKTDQIEALVKKKEGGKFEQL